MCPVSNEFVVQSLKSNEILQMLNKEMLVTINSDDPAYFRAYLNENFVRLQEEGKLSHKQLTTLASNAFKVAWLDDKEKQHYLRLVSDYKTLFAQ